MSPEIITPFPKPGPKELLEEAWKKQDFDRHTDQRRVKLKTKEPKKVKEICRETLENNIVGEVDYCWQLWRQSSEDSIYRIQ